MIIPEGIKVELKQLNRKLAAADSARRSGQPGRAVEIYTKVASSVTTILNSIDESKVETIDNAALPDAQVALYDALTNKESPWFDVNTPLEFCEVPEVDMDPPDTARHIRARAYIGWGLSAQMIADYDIALEKYKKAIEYFENKRPSGLLPLLYRLSGSVSEECSDWGNAVHWYTLSESEYSYNGELELSLKMKQCKGVGFIHLGQYQMAERLLNESRTDAERGGLESLAAEIDSSMAFLAEKQDDYGTALMHRKKSLELYQRLKAWEQIVAGSIEIAVSLINTGQLGEAEEHLEIASKGLKFVPEEFRKRLEAGLAETTGHRHLSSGNSREALASLKRSWELWEALRITPKMAEVAYLIGKIYCGTDQANEAVRWLRESIRLTEEMRSQLLVEEFRTSFMEGRIEVYGEMVRLLATSEPAQAVDFAERAKARTFLDAVAGGKKSQDEMKDDFYQSRLEKLRQRIEGLHTRIFGNQAFQAVRDIVTVSDSQELTLSDQLKRELDEAYSDYQALLLESKSANPEVAMQESTSPVSLSEFGKILPGDKAIIEFFIFKSEIFAFVVKSGRQLGIKIRKPYDSIKDDVLQIREAIESEEDLPALQEKLEILGSVLLGEITGHLDGINHLIIIPHGLLHLLPFHALRISGRYLIEDYSISYAPSLSVLYHCLQKPKREARLLCALGNPDSTLKESEREVASIGKYVPFSFVRTGSNATKEWLLNVSEKYCDIAHIACHAHFSSEAPLFSYLQLAQSKSDTGQLSGYEIINKFQAPQLVTLSACQTAVSDVSTGDELQGLTRAFFHAGAATVVSSLWSVDDPATAELMNRFYAELLNGDRASALRKAQLDLISIPEYRHPRLWAAFVLMGDWLHLPSVEEHYAEQPLEIWPPFSTSRDVYPFTACVLTTHEIKMPGNQPIKILGIQHPELFDVTHESPDGNRILLSLKYPGKKPYNKRVFKGNITLKTNIGDVLIPYDIEFSPAVRVEWSSCEEIPERNRRLSSYEAVIKNTGYDDAIISDVFCLSQHDKSIRITSRDDLPHGITPGGEFKIKIMFDFRKAGPRVRSATISVDIQELGKPLKTEIEAETEPVPTMLSIISMGAFGCVITAMVCAIGPVLLAQLFPVFAANQASEDSLMITQGIFGVLSCMAVAQFGVTTLWLLGGVGWEFALSSGVVAGLAVIVSIVINVIAVIILFIISSLFGLFGIDIEGFINSVGLWIWGIITFGCLAIVAASMFMEDESFTEKSRWSILGKLNSIEVVAVIIGFILSIIPFAHALNMLETDQVGHMVGAYSLIGLILGACMGIGGGMKSAWRYARDEIPFRWENMIILIVIGVVSLLVLLKSGVL